MVGNERKDKFLVLFVSFSKGGGKVVFIRKSYYKNFISLRTLQFKKDQK